MLLARQQGSFHGIQALVHGQLSRLQLRPSFVQTLCFDFQSCAFIGAGLFALRLGVCGRFFPERLGHLHHCIGKSCALPWYLYLFSGTAGTAQTPSQARKPLLQHGADRIG